MIAGTNTIGEAKDGWLATKDGMYDVSWAKLGPWPSGIACREAHLSYNLQSPTMPNDDEFMAISRATQHQSWLYCGYKDTLQDPQVP